MFTLRFNGMFVGYDGVVATFEESQRFYDYDDCMDYIDAKRLCERGYVEMFTDYGTPNEVYEEI